MVCFVEVGGPVFAGILYWFLFVNIPSRKAYKGERERKEERERF